MGPKVFRTILSPWVLLAALGIAAVLTIVTFSILWLALPSSAPRAPATAILTVIPAPTATQLPVTQPSESAAQTPAIIPSLPPGVLGNSVFVQITGTGGDGLRLRTEPGLQGEVRFLGLEAEVFQIMEGPQEKDGYTWWFLVAPYDEDRSGWAVSDFLEVIEP